MPNLIASGHVYRKAESTAVSSAANHTSLTYAAPTVSAYSPNITRTTAVASTNMNVSSLEVSRQPLPTALDHSSAHIVVSPAEAEAIIRSMNTLTISESQGKYTFMSLCQSYRYLHSTWFVSLCYQYGLLRIIFSLILTIHVYIIHAYS